MMVTNDPWGFWGIFVPCAIVMWASVPLLIFLLYKMAFDNPPWRK